MHPLLFAWQVPSFGTNALYSAWGFVAAFFAVHCSRPVVEIAVSRNIIFVSVGIVEVRHGFAYFRSQLYVACVAQVFGQPSLVADGYKRIYVAVAVVNEEVGCLAYTYVVDCGRRVITIIVIIIFPEESKVVHACFLNVHSRSAVLPFRLFRHYFRTAYIYPVWIVACTRGKVGVDRGRNEECPKVVVIFVSGCSPVEIELV